MRLKNSKADSKIEDYSLEEHQRRFSVWAAFAATRRGVKSYSLKNIHFWLDKIDFEKLLAARSCKKFDELHKIAREDFVKLSNVSHGRAAKILNIYLKAQLPIFFSKNPKLEEYIHPPLDRLLLEAISQKYKTECKCYRQNFPQEKNEKKLDPLSWSKFSCKQYEAAIKLVRNCVKEEPLWKIEYLWDGLKEN